ncbi:DNA-binding protein [Salmonella enterica]|uniref:DNA-binding protein n=1 Tax=Salmonella sp. NCTC 6947 TaxID=2583581 RepID=A0A509CR19_9ENTR|nr:DNA-binding protein [Salmonella enterica]
MIQKSKEMVRLPEIINDLAFHASQVLIESMNIDSASAENAGQAIAGQNDAQLGRAKHLFPQRYLWSSLGTGLSDLQRVRWA